MSEVPVFRFKAPGPWVTRDLRDCVLASDYDALAERLAEAEREQDALRELLREALNAWTGEGPPIDLDRIRAALERKP